MLEVNAQWEHMCPALAQDHRSVHFANEAERIAAHLHHVADHLHAHVPHHLTPSTLAKRNALLGALDAYADRGVFPRNEVLPYRNPVFIDPHGTACAVGQLMIESGHRGLAERIDLEQEPGYVAELLRSPSLGPAITAWAAENGFSGEELAWIQPGYPPNTLWTAVGGGTNGAVHVLLELPDGSMAIAGEFTEAGGMPVNNVVRWDGAGFLAMGNGVAGTITCGVVLGDDVYLGGYSLNGNHDLAHWDGTQWSYSTVFQGKLPQTTALFAHQGSLYAAGISVGFAGSDYAVQMLSNGAWEPMGEGFDQVVSALAWHEGQLVAGGQFTTSAGPSGGIMQHVATLGGSGWAQLADGLDAKVNVLLSVGDTLYAGGTILLNITPRFGLARISGGGAPWQPLLPNAASYVNNAPGPAEVMALAPTGAGLYVGGSFGLYQGTLLGQHLAFFSGTPDDLMPVAVFNNPVHALARNLQGNDLVGLYAGGAFTENAFDTVPHLAETTISTGMHPMRGAPAGLIAYPDPADDRLTVVLDEPAPPNANLDMVDAQGRLVRSQAFSGSHSTLLVAPLAPGTYTLRLSADGWYRSHRFIKR